VAPTGVVIGVVDIGKAFDTYPRTIKEAQRLKQVAEAMQEEVRRVTSRIDELRATIPLLKEGRERREKQLEYDLALRQREGMSTLFNEEMDAEAMRVHLSIYEDLEGAIAQLAKERGVHLVLKINAGALQADKGDGDDPRRSLRMRHEQFRERQVWFAAEEVDLTSDLIKMLQVPVDRGPAPAAPPGPRGDKNADPGSGAAGGDKGGN
jgi:Skp family chaperone for outer membrane proteins